MLSNPHTDLEKRYPWYKNWHKKSWASRLHLELLILYVLIVLLIISNFFPITPFETKAARPIYGIASSLGSIDATTREKALTMIQNAGSTWIRIGAYWPWADRNGKANRDWSVSDNFISDAKRHNQTIVGSIAGYASWANGGAGDWYAAADPVEFANFTRDTVTRYKADVHYWEIWNEPNLKEFWTAEDPYTNTDAASAHYAKLLRAAYLAVKQADPTAKVIYGGLSRNDFNYLNKTYSAIKKYPDAASYNNFFDVLSVHPYCDDRPPESSDPAYIWSNMDRNFSGLPKMKIAMENQGDTTKHIMVTEFGWVVSDISWTKGVGYVNQADFLKRAYAMAQNWTWLDAMMWYGFKNWDNAEGPYSLVNTDLSARLSYDAFKSIAIQPPPADTTSPTVFIASPASNATVSGVVNITANASDNVQVSRIDFFVDGTYKGVDSTVPYNYSWDSKTVSGGSHTVKAKAYDTSGLTAESSITVNVGNTPLISDTIPPVVTIVSPVNNSSLYSPGFTTIVTDVTDNVAVAKVEFYINGVLSSTISTAPYQYGWRLKKNNRGVRIINVKSYDSSGLTSTSQITITIK